MGGSRKFSNISLPPEGVLRGPLEKGGMAEEFYARWAAVAQPAARQSGDWRVAGSTLDVNSLHSEVHLN